MADHIEQATAAPGEDRRLSPEGAAFLRQQCAVRGHTLEEIGENEAECERCGARFRLVEW